MSHKIIVTTDQKRILNLIGTNKPESAIAVAKLSLSDNELSNIRSTKWKDFDITKNQLKYVQLAKSFITAALAERLHSQDLSKNFNLNQQARRNCHHVDISQLTGKETDFIETPWLNNRGNEGQVRQKNAQIVELKQPVKRSAVA